MCFPIAAGIKLLSKISHKTVSQTSQNTSLSLIRALHVEEANVPSKLLLFHIHVSWVIEETVLHARLADNLRAALFHENVPGVFAVLGTVGAGRIHAMLDKEAVRVGVSKHTQACWKVGAETCAYFLNVTAWRCM